MQLFRVVFVIFGLSICTRCEKIAYDNCRVYSIRPENEQQLKFLQGIEVHDQDLLFLTAPLSTRFAADIVVPPHKLDYLNGKIAEYGLNSEIKTENLQR